MPRVTFLLGLCGSGKSRRAKQISHDTGAEIFDHVHAKSTLRNVRQNLRKGKDCVVEEIHLCYWDYRENVVRQLSTVSRLDIEWICFENDLADANWNATYRTNKLEPEAHCCINRGVSPCYTYPVGVTPIPIRRVEPFFANVSGPSSISSGQLATTIEVLGPSDKRSPIGTASQIDKTVYGLALWSLRVRDTDVPGRWVIVRQRFVPIEHFPVWNGSGKRECDPVLPESWGACLIAQNAAKSPCSSRLQ